MLVRLVVHDKAREAIVECRDLESSQILPIFHVVELASEFHDHLCLCQAWRVHNVNDSFGAGLVVEGDALDGGGVNGIDNGLHGAGVDCNAYAEPVQQEGGSDGDEAGRDENDEQKHPPSTSSTEEFTKLALGHSGIGRPLLEGRQGCEVVVFVSRDHRLMNTPGISVSILGAPEVVRSVVGGSRPGLGSKEFRGRGCCRRSGRVVVIASVVEMGVDVGIVAVVAVMARMTRMGSIVRCGRVDVGVVRGGRSGMMKVPFHTRVLVLGDSSFSSCSVSTHARVGPNDILATPIEFW